MRPAANPAPIAETAAGAAGTVTAIRTGRAALNRRRGSLALNTNRRITPPPRPPARALSHPETAPTRAKALPARMAAAAGVAAGDDVAGAAREARPPPQRPAPPQIGRAHVRTPLP